LKIFEKTVSREAKADAHKTR